MSHRITAVSHTAGDATVTTLMVSQGSFDPQTEKQIERHGGSTVAGAVSITRHRPMARFTFLDVGAAIDFFGISGYQIDQNIELWTALRTEGAGMGPTGTKVSYSDGIIVPTTLTGSQGENATIEYALYAGASGTKPYSISTAASLPDLTGVLTNLWTIGPGTLGGADLGPLIRQNVEFGPDPYYEEGDGEVYPLALGINGWDITATLTSIAADDLDGPDAGDASDVVMQFNKKTETGIDSSGHLSLAFDDELTTLNELRGDRESNAETTLEVTGLSSDFSTFPISTSYTA